MAVGEAIRETLGEAVVTLTVTLSGADVPPVPLQVTEYVFDAVMAPVETLPEVAPPVLKPVPVHDVALVDHQVKVELPPDDTDVGFAEILAVGVLGDRTV